MQYIGNLEIEQESTVVVHDPGTGNIVHVHHVVTAKGGKHPDRTTLEKEALDQLSRAQPKVSKAMAVLHVEPGQIKPNLPYKVDVKKRVLVEARKEST
jgi:hypothetical protein